MNRVAIFAAGLTGVEIVFNTIRELNNNSDIKLICTHPNDDKFVISSIAHLASGRGIVHITETLTHDTWPDLLKVSNLDTMFLIMWPEDVPDEIHNHVKNVIVIEPSLIEPYERSYTPHFWAVYENRKLGVVARKIDRSSTYKIYFEKEIPVNFTDNGQTLHVKQKQWMINFFHDHYTELLNLDNLKYKQYSKKLIRNPFDGTTRNKEQFDALTSTMNLDQFELDIEGHVDTESSKLINKIRAVSFPSNESFVVEKGGEKYYVRMEIEKIKK